MKWSGVALLSALSLLIGCVEIPEAEKAQDVLVLVHATECIKVEGLRLGAEVAVDVVRRQDGQSISSVEVRGDSQGLVEISQAGDKLSLKGLKAGEATITLNDQPWELEIAAPDPMQSARASVRWPGVNDSNPARALWSDEPHALFNGISERGTRLWGWTDDDQVSLSTNDHYQGEHKVHRITLRPNQGEQLRNVQLSLSASDFNVAPDTRISWIPDLIPNSVVPPEDQATSVEY